LQDKSLLKKRFVLFFCVATLTLLADLVSKTVVFSSFCAGYDLFLTLTLGLISGGIMGNLYDRLGWGALPSYPESIRTNVRDFILFRLEGVPFFDPWPNFNLADCWLVCGAALLFFHALFLAPPDDVSAAPEKDAFNVN
jgi:signal peptidase II